MQRLADTMELTPDPQTVKATRTRKRHRKPEHKQGHHDCIDTVR
jgi:hypothetical protein